MLELFVDKIHFFKFLSVSDKPLEPAKNHLYNSHIAQTSLNYSIRTRKGKYTVLKINAKFHQPIKHAKTSYSIASLAFYRFSCMACQNGINRGTTRLRYYRHLKKYEPC